MHGDGAGIDRHTDGLRNVLFRGIAHDGVFYLGCRWRQRGKAVTAAGPLQLMGSSTQTFPIGSLSLFRQVRSDMRQLFDKKNDELAIVRIAAKTGIDWVFGLAPVAS